MKKKTKWITRTAVMIALLIVLQAATKAFGQFVTGSSVNFILAITVLTCGLSSAITVAVLSPLFAFILGIGTAFLPIVPVICIGNMLLVMVLWFILHRGSADPAKGAVAIVAASLVKFAALYLLVVKTILPMLSLNEKQISVISVSFSWPQFVTAMIGSTIALFIYPRVRKVLSNLK